MQTPGPRLCLLSLVLVALPLLVLTSGCGYTVSTELTEGTRGTKVAVSPFRNSTRPYEPGIEQQLHAELLDALMTGPWILASPDDADLLITGEILRFRQSILSLRTDLEPSEVRVVIQVSVTVHDVKRRTNWTDTLAPINEQFAVVGGETLRDTADRGFRELARDVIDTFVAPEDRWGSRHVNKLRLEELRYDLQNALDDGDEPRADKLRAEIDQLEQLNGN